MVTKLSYSLAEVIGKMLESDKDQISIYGYALEIIIGAAVKLICILTLAAFLNILAPAILVLICFAAFRLYAGGVHLSVFGRCLLMGTLIIIILSELAVRLSGWGITIPVLAIFTIMVGFIIIRWAPAGTEKNPLIDPVKIHKRTVRLWILFIVWLLAMFTLEFYGNDIIALAMLFGGMGGIFMVTPIAYLVFHGLDRMFNKIGKGVI
jgi:accessory gene regulator B